MSTVHRTSRAHRKQPIAFSMRIASIGIVVLAMLPGCSLVGGSKSQATVYAPDPRVAPDPAWPSVRWQLAVSRPDSARVIDSMRIAVRPTPGELEVYKDASWSRTPTEQVENTVLRALEDSQRIPAVALKGSGIAADYILLMDVRRFEADYAGNAVPAATIEVTAKLVHAVAQDVVASRTFLQATPAAAVGTASVAQAFGTSLGAIAHDIAGWTLITGDAHERMPGHGNGKAGHGIK